VHVPILKQGDYLIATIQSVLSDADLLQLRDDLADRVGQFRSRGVIVDVTVLDVIDSFATRTLRGVAHMLKLRGAETVIVAMVQLGLTLEGVGTALDLEEGLAFLSSRTKRGGSVWRSTTPVPSSKSKAPPGARGKGGNGRPQ
jgi:rsbT antagonist protein RsbS